MEILKKVMEKVMESHGIWRAQKSTNHVIKYFVFIAKSEYGGIFMLLVTTYVPYIFAFYSRQ